MLVVVAVLLFVAGGADAIAHAIAGPPIQIAGVTLHPQAGWEVQRRGDDGSLHRVVLARGSGALDVTVIDAYPGTADGLARQYEDSVLAGQLDQLSVGDPEAGALDDGTPTVRYGYIGITHTGWRSRAWSRPRSDPRARASCSTGTRRRAGSRRWSAAWPR